MTLSDYLLKYTQAQFGWGTADCVLFSFGWIKDQTGKDLLAGIEPWTGKTQALRRVAGFGSLELGAMHLLGLPRQGFEDGDVAYMPPPFNSLGIVSGSSVAVLTEDGLGVLSVHDAKHIWSVKNV